MTMLPADDSSTTSPSEPLARVYLLERPQPTSGMQFIVLGWCLWLIGTWVMWSFLESRTTAARWMIVTGMLGLMAVWPAARLSVLSHRPLAGRPTLRPVGLARLQAMRAASRQRRGMQENHPGPGLVFLEWAVLIFLLQAVVWMLAMHTSWSLRQTLWLNITLTSWSLMTALIVGWASSRRSAWVRTLAMLLCLLLLIGEPVAIMLLAGTEMGRTLADHPLYLNPFEAIWQLSYSESKLYLDPWPVQVLRIGAAATAGWLVLAGFAILRWRKNRGTKTDRENRSPSQGAGPV